MIVATLVACLSAAWQDKRQRETDTKEVTVKAFDQALGSSFGILVGCNAKDSEDIKLRHVAPQRCSISPYR